MLHLLYVGGSGQACTNLGQTPGTAFPVCALDTFYQAKVPLCDGTGLTVPNCPNVFYSDKNPYWYRFTCYSSGTLGFSITPNNLDDDYDWQLFDVTGQNPNSVYTNASLAITGNWSGNTSLESARGYTGVTGTASSATDIFVCATNPPELGGNPPYTDATTFNRMPDLIQGHTYLLMISHYTDTQSGYGLSFGGGTAVIIDTLKPAMLTARSNCAGDNIYVKLNKKIKCNSLAGNGTDFMISPFLANVKSVVATDCGSSFDMDSVVITLNKPLPPGNYSLVVEKGTDNSTLLDDCDTPIPIGDSISFVVYAIQPTPMDSISPVFCAPDIVQLVFRNQMQCGSISPDGSDFIIKGSQGVSIKSAYGVNCTNGLSNIINVQFSKPIQTAGNFTLSLRKGGDNNTLLDECAQETPPASLNFATADTVSADFSYRVGLGCVFDTLLYAHDGRNGVNQWNWSFDLNGASTAQDSIFLFNDYGTKHIQLACSNGVCTDTAATDILLDNELISRFQVAPSPELCPEDIANFTDSSTGKILTWFWTFGDGSSSGIQNPPPKKYQPVFSKEGRIYPVVLIVKNDIGCFDTAVTNMKILYNCYIDVPTAFTPNGDGLNDYLYPLNAYKAVDLEFKVFNRYGQLVFATNNWTRKWDGKINGTPQSSGTYVWMLSYTHRDTGKRYALKGTVVLIR